MREYLVQTLLHTVDAYLAIGGGLSEPTVADYATGSHDYFERLRGGNARVSGVMYDKIMDWFDTHWPENTPRPLPLDDWKAIKQWEASNTWSCAPEDWPRLLVQAGMREDAA